MGAGMGPRALVHARGLNKCMCMYNWDAGQIGTGQRWAIGVCSHVEPLRLGLGLGLGSVAMCSHYGRRRGACTCICTCMLCMLCALVRACAWQVGTGRVQRHRPKQPQPGGCSFLGKGDRGVIARPAGEIAPWDTTLVPSARGTRSALKSSTRYERPSEGPSGRCEEARCGVKRRDVVRRGAIWCEECDVV